MPTAHSRPWHRGSLFGPGPRRPLDREQRARFKFLLRAHARARRISAKCEWVGNALLKRLSTDGQCDPAHETIAADVGCCARTVRRATSAMRALGLLRWRRRLVRVGWRCAQTSNSYLLVATAALPDCGGQTGRETRKESFPPAAPPSLAAIREAQAGLARRRRVIEAKLLGKRGGDAFGRA